MKKCHKCGETLPDIADTCPKCFIDLKTGKHVPPDQYAQKDAKTVFTILKA